MKIELAKKNSPFYWNRWNRNEWSFIGYEKKGFKVQGSDISNNKNVERLKKEKIKIFLGHSKKI